MMSGSSRGNLLAGLDPGLLRELVIGYLTHHCFVSTSFLLLDGSAKDQRLGLSLQNRSRILALLRAGLISDAIQLIDEVFPDLLCKHKRIRFLLSSQQFIEDIRHKRITTALSSAQSQLRPLALNDPEITAELQPIVGLLAVKNPSASNSRFLRQDRREQVASEVNKVMLGAQGLRERSALEDLSRQLVAVEKALESHSVRRLLNCVLTCAAIVFDVGRGK